MDGSRKLPGVASGGIASTALDPSTTYCTNDACQQLRRITSVVEAHGFDVVARVPTLRTGELHGNDRSTARWVPTGARAWERSVRLECGHTKGLIGV